MHSDPETLFAAYLLGWWMWLAGFALLIITLLTRRWRLFFAWIVALLVARLVLIRLLFS